MSGPGYGDSCNNPLVEFRGYCNCHRNPIITNSDESGKKVNTAITFNASGVHHKTVEMFGVKMDNLANQSFIYALNTDRDPLTYSQAHKEALGNVAQVLTKIANELGIDVPFALTPEQERRLAQEAPQAAGHRVEIESSYVIPSRRPDNIPMSGDFPVGHYLAAHSQISVIESIYTGFILDQWKGSYNIGGH